MITVHDKMQTNYRYDRVAPMGDNFHPQFRPELSPKQMLAMGVFGVVRLQSNPTRLVENVRLRLMQPNLQQDVKFNYAAKQEVMNKYISLSDRATVG